MNKAQPLGTFEESGLMFGGRCAVSGATIYSKAIATEMIVYDAVDAGDEDLELLHVVGMEGTSVINIAVPKVATKGLYLKVIDGDGGINIDIVA